MSLNVPGMYAVGTVLPIIGTTAVVARFYVRRMKRADFGVDDWTAFTGMLGMWGIAAVILAGTAKGLFGTHTAMDPETGSSSITWRDRKDVEYQWIVQILTIVSITLIKLSVIFLYRRLLKISRAFNIYSMVLAVLVAMWGIAFTVALIFDCGKRPWASWTSAKTVIAYCDNIDAAQVGFCLSDLIMDFMILLAPIPMIWRLQMSTSEKLQVLGIFALGFLSTAASAARAAIMTIDAYDTTLSYRDVIGENSRVVTWSLVEVAAAITGCCLPTLRPLVAGKSLHSIFGSFRSAFSLHSYTGRSASKFSENGSWGSASHDGSRHSLGRSSEARSPHGSVHKYHAGYNV